METKPPLSYGRQWIREDDERAVLECLRGDWLTQGPAVERFEGALCEATGARHAVAVSSGTAALHLAVLACGLGTGDVGLVPSITFVASANAIAYAGGRVRFADVDPETALVDPESLRQKVDELSAEGLRPRVIVPVDFAGQPADLATIRAIADRVGASVIEDAAHSLGADYQAEGKSWRVGACGHADATILSFHPVKHITTAEGGAVLTGDGALARRVRELRSHGIHRDPARLERTGEGGWYYEQASLGFNYRLTDLQCSLGLSQLRRLGEFVARRRHLAGLYDAALAREPLSRWLTPLRRLPDRGHAYHLYVVRVSEPGEPRRRLYDALRARGILAQVHYIPVHCQPYFRDHHGARPDECPSSLRYYESCLSLPLYPAMKDEDVARVVEGLQAWGEGR